MRIGVTAALETSLRTQLNTCRSIMERSVPNLYRWRVPRKNSAINSSEKKKRRSWRWSINWLGWMFSLFLVDRNIRSLIKLCDFIAFQNAWKIKLFQQVCRERSSSASITINARRSSLTAEEAETLILMKLKKNLSPMLQWTKWVWGSWAQLYTVPPPLSSHHGRPWARMTHTIVMSGCSGSHSSQSFKLLYWLWLLYINK